jgi:hypothetical protein
MTIINPETIMAIALDMLKRWVMIMTKGIINQYQARHCDDLKEIYWMPPQ